MRLQDDWVYGAGAACHVTPACLLGARMKCLCSADILRLPALRAVSASLSAFVDAPRHVERSTGMTRRKLSVLCDLGSIRGHIFYLLRLLNGLLLGFFNDRYWFSEFRVLLIVYNNLYFLWVYLWLYVFSLVVCCCFF